VKYEVTYEMVSVDAESDVHVKKFQSDITRISEILQTVKQYNVTSCQ